MNGGTYSTSNDFIRQTSLAMPQIINYKIDVIHKKNCVLYINHLCSCYVKTCIMLPMGNLRWIELKCWSCMHGKTSNICAALLVYVNIIQWHKETALLIFWWAKKVIDLLIPLERTHFIRHVCSHTLWASWL